MSLLHPVGRLDRLRNLHIRTVSRRNPNVDLFALEVVQNLAQLPYMRGSLPRRSFADWRVKRSIDP
jgi:hypothetical protein